MMTYQVNGAGISSFSSDLITNHTSGESPAAHFGSLLSMLVRLGNLALSIFVLCRLFVPPIGVPAPDALLVILIDTALFIWLFGSVGLCAGIDSCHRMVFPPLLFLLLFCIYVIIDEIRVRGSIFERDFTLTMGSAQAIAFAYAAGALTFGLWYVRRLRRPVLELDHPDEASTVDS